MIASGLAFGLGLYILAPQLIHLTTGSDFLPAVVVLRILSPLPLLLSITYSVGLQWLLPFGHDAVVNRIILTAGAFNLVIAFLAAPRFQHIGMAVSVLVSEIYVCISMVMAVVARVPFWRQGRPLAEPQLATPVERTYDA